MKNFGYRNRRLLEEYGSPAKMVQDIIKIITASFLVLISFKGLLTFYGAKQGNWLEQTVNFITAPLVAPFERMFMNSKAYEAPVFMSFLVILSIGALSYALAGLFLKYSLRQKLKQEKDFVDVPVKVRRVHGQSFLRKLPQ